MRPVERRRGGEASRRRDGAVSFPHAGRGDPGDETTVRCIYVEELTPTWTAIECVLDESDFEEVVVDDWDHEKTKKRGGEERRSGGEAVRDAASAARPSARSSPPELPDDCEETVALDDSKALPPAPPTHDEDSAPDSGIVAVTPPAPAPTPAATNERSAMLLLRARVRALHAALTPEQTAIVVAASFVLGAAFATAVAAVL